MDVDESFAEYVAARWSMHYRLATLLVGEERATELTRAALVRAYLSWPEVQQAASADARVKAILAGTAVKGATTLVQAGTRDVDLPPQPGPEKLWAEISSLLPWQRAVLVLRHYEGLSDAEIADALGGSATSVAAEVLALETGIDLADLRAELLRRSDEALVPPPPLDALVIAGHRARHRRRRRSWGWVAGVAAVVAGALVLAGIVQDQAGRGRPGGPASSAEPARFLSLLPEGPPPRIAYTEGRTLRLGNGREVALADPASTVVQTKKGLLVAYLSGAIVRVDAATGKIQQVVGASQGELVTDAAGEHVAWLAAGSGAAVVVVGTVADRAVNLMDEQAFPATPRCCDNPFLVNGMTQDGQVIASLPATHEAWVWGTPDGGTDQVRRISGLGTGAIDQVTAVGVVVRRPPSQYAVGRLDGGQFLRSAVLTAQDAEFGDPLGHRVVFTNEDGEIHVREVRFRARSRRGSQDVRLVLPVIAGGFSRARWEDADHVLLDVADPSQPYGALVRCAVDSGACEVAARFDGPHLLAD